MDELVRVMKALSDPGRVRVLKLLHGRELCACELIRLLGLAQPTVSRHMKVLAEAGLVASRRVGPWVHYRLAARPASPYAREMLSRLAQWLEDDAGVAEMRARLDQGTPGEGCGPEPRGRAPRREARP